MKGITQETRSETIFRHTNAMLHVTRTSMSSFAQQVVENYHDEVPPEARCVEFKMDGDMYRVATTNAQKLHRYMEHEVNARLPVDLEESWVRALCEPYRTECRRELARRYGLLDVSVPSPLFITDIETTSRLMKEVGEALVAISPALADSEINVEDARHLPAALKEIDDVISAAHSLRARLVRAQESITSAGDHA